MFLSGRMCSQMLAALALLQPPVESAHNRRAWIDQIMAELAWARRVMDQEEKGNVRACMVYHGVHLSQLVSCTRLCARLGGFVRFW